MVRGLLPDLCPVSKSCRSTVAPALRGGRGLKLADFQRGARPVDSSARPPGRARIETACQPFLELAQRRSARPPGRARIETIRRATSLRNCPVAPALRGGRGLKPDVGRSHVIRSQVAPALRGGRGLKQIALGTLAKIERVAPALRGGRGLKHHFPLHRVQVFPVAPALRGGRGLKHIERTN